MVTGCAPIFILGLLGVSLGSWFFGTHIAARLTGLVALAGFMLYFALLNWTAQSNIARKNTMEKSEPDEKTTDNVEGDVPFTDEDRLEWNHYLKSEGRILWTGFVFLAVVIVALIVRK
ncbi:MAG: hypothetical protein HOC91_00985 [Nitrospinaceae bacterium]|jgi:hypothetical protein|nr:hypothetical protein [Nitrospinaceae bacterium]MBT3435165.1 hypothetical protein [Nitrospinaceae bacterium]MBT3821883.1 hypothetical protein [Nitrospinaceae bacterium]MBT4094768.1 hypothetical protein [Nitrospinaceae bacterium]MBT4429068.1 hypothetical protein [Nitrospinaceae bacterium]